MRDEQKKSALGDILRSLASPFIAVALAVLTSWAASQAKISSLETRANLYEKSSYDLVREKDKYYEQFLSIQKQLAKMEQQQLDMKEDLTEIKKHLSTTYTHPRTRD